MPWKPYQLTDDEVARADMLAMRIVMAVLLNAFFQTHPNRDMAYQEIEQAISHLGAQLKLSSIPQERQDAFRQAVADHGKALIENARNLQKMTGPPH